MPPVSLYTSCTQHFHDIHLTHNTSVIYILHPTLPWFTIRPQTLAIPYSQKFQTIYHSLQSLQHSCPSQFTFIMLLLVTNQHTGSLIGINNQKTHSTTIYESPTDPWVGAIINLAPKNFFIYNSVIYILHPKLISSTIAWYTSCSQKFHGLQFVHKLEHGLHLDHK